MSESEEPKIRICIREFVDWYFNLEDDLWIFNDIQYELTKNKKYCLDVYELFDEAGYIPAHLRVDYDHRRHKDDEYDPGDCILVEES